MNLIFATRPSALARMQTRWVIQALQALHPDLICEELLITTQGDKIRDRPLPEIGGKGLFTLELEQALLSGAAHGAVHSLKDLPVEDPPGLVLGCIPRRAEVRDALVSASAYTLATLPPQAQVGTSSPRRRAQLLAVRPDLQVQSLRGNVDTRLRKAYSGQYTAIVLAGAGLLRLGMQEHIHCWLSLEEMLPAPGQGALAVQCRAEDAQTLALLAALEDALTRQAVTAERSFLAGLGGGCAVPVAAYARPDPQNPVALQLSGLVLTPDGRQSVRVAASGVEPEFLGARLAQQALAEGAAEILARPDPGE